MRDTGYKIMYVHWLLVTR